MSEARFDPNGTGTRPDYPRAALRARLVAVMRLVVADRGLALIPQVSRCIRRHDVHEFILTPEPGAPGGRIGQTAYLGFAEFETGGVLLWGDEVVVAGRPIGTIAGYDETHMPNHLNIVVTAGDCRDGVALGLRLGEAVEIRPVYTPVEADG